MKDQPVVVLGCYLNDLGRWVTFASKTVAEAKSHLALTGSSISFYVEVNPDKDGTLTGNVEDYSK